MLTRTAISAILVVLAILMAPARAQDASAYKFDPVLADYQQVPVAARRSVIAQRLEVRTRPIPEAAVLDVLVAGAQVGVVSEGGGWATMDLGGGFLGWMRADGLGPATEAPRSSSKPKIAPIPADRSRRPTSMAQATTVEISVHAQSYMPSSVATTAPAADQEPKRRF